MQALINSQIAGTLQKCWVQWSQVLCIKHVKHGMQSTQHFYRILTGGVGWCWNTVQEKFGHFWAKIFKVEDSYAYTDVYVFLYVYSSYAYTDPRLN